MSLCSCQGGSSSALCPALSFCRGALSSICARPCGSVGAVYARCAPVFAVLSRRLSSVCAQPCGSVAALCPWFARGLTILSRRFALGLRAALRFCWGGLPRFTPAVCLATNRTACDVLRSYSAGSRSPFVRSRSVGAVICLGWFTSGFGVSLWRSRRGAGERGTGLRGERGWRRGLCASLRKHIGFVVLSSGSTLGLRAPNLRQRVFDSLDSLQGLAEQQSTLCAAALAL